VLGVARKQRTAAVADGRWVARPEEGVARPEEGVAQPATAAGWYPREGQAAGHSLPAADRATAGVGSVVGVRSSWLPPAHRTPYWHKPTVGGFVDSGSHDLCADARLAGPMSGAACERDLAAAAGAGSTHRGAVSVAVQASSRFPATPHSSRCGCRGPPLGPGTWRQRCSRGSRCRSRTRRLRAHGADPSAGSRHTSALHLRAMALATGMMSSMGSRDEAGKAVGPRNSSG